MTSAAATALDATTLAATNEHLASMSNTLVYSSMAVYTLAFFAYIFEWLLGSRSRVARTANALTTKADAKNAPSVTVKKAGGTAVLDSPQVVVRDPAGARVGADGAGAPRGDG
ncbi:c-type cytochrome biogenesis protein CcsB, partial [Streptomyces sp. NPDC059627]